MTTPRRIDVERLRTLAAAVIAADEACVSDDSDGATGVYLCAARDFRNYVDAGSVLALLAELEAAREAMERMHDEAEEAMGDAHLTGDTGDKRGEHVLMLPDRIRALRAERDALAERFRVAEAENDELRTSWTDAVVASEGTRAKLARYEKEFGDVDGLRTYVGKFQTQRNLAEARAERLADMIRSIATIADDVFGLRYQQIDRGDANPVVLDRWMEQVDDLRTAIETMRGKIAADTAEKEK